MTPAPCDWDQESYCVEPDCRQPATHRRPVGATTVAHNIDPDGLAGVIELVCCGHAMEGE